MGKAFPGGTGKLELEGPSGLTFRSAGGVWTVWRRKTGMIDLIGYQLLVAFDNASAHSLGKSGYGASISLAVNPNVAFFEQTHVTPSPTKQTIHITMISCPQGSG